MGAKNTARAVGLGLLAALTTAGGVEAASCDAWSLQERYGAELGSLAGADQAETLFRGHLKDAFGVVKDQVAFLEALSGGSYAREITYLIEEPRWKVFLRDRWSGRLIKQIDHTIATGSRAEPLTRNIDQALGRIGNSVTALTIGAEIVKAIGGDDAAKIKAVAETVKAQQGWLVAKIGSKSLGLAMSGVAFIDWSLGKFIKTQQRDYHDYWWNAYTNYMEAKHAQIVTGPQSWSGLVEEGGPDAVQARLEEFWQDTVDGGPLEKATSYYRRPGPFQRDALAIARFRRSFAARYYRDSLAPTLKTYFQRKAEDAQIELATETNRHCDRLLQALEELSALKAAVDWARVELEAGTSAAPKPASAGGVTESVLLVLDASGSMKNGGRMEKAKQSAARIVERLGGETEVALIVFYDCRNVVVEQSFTTDRRALTAALAPVRPSGSTPLAKAVAFADHYLAKNAASERQKLIVLTDGKETCGGDPIAVAGNLPTR